MDVSIIIPVYNAKDFIVDCLKSVSAQTFKGYTECILIDDCGSDNSISLAEEYIASYVGNVGFVICRQEFNQGPSAARNRGIREAKGEYIFFLDADDRITPECLETLYSLAKEYGSDYVQGRYYEENRFEKPIILDNKKDIKTLLLDYSKIQFTPHNRLLRRQMILDHNLFFNEQIRVREDFLWMTFVAKYVNRFASTNVETYIRGYNEDSLTHNTNREREILGYKVLIENMCANMDPFLKDCQKELALDVLLMCFRSGFYHEREKSYLVNTVAGGNIIEKILLNMLLLTNFSIIHNLLVRLYKIVY